MRPGSPHRCPPARRARARPSPRRDRREREAGGQALGDRHQVRRYPRMLDGEELAGPAETGLDLVGDEHDAVALGELAQRPQELRWRGDEAALAEDRLDDDRGDPLWRNL